MAFMKPAKDKEVETAAPVAPPAPPPAPKPLAPPPPPAPTSITLVMARDGGLNGKCWRGGDTITLDPEAADWYLANGHATRAK